MRLPALVALTLLCAACSPQPEPVPAAPASSPTAGAVDPSRIDRARRALPAGYEVTPYTGAPAPLAVWGFAGPVQAQPSQCGTRAAPPVYPGSARGWSASGPGGIVYAVVAAAAPSAPVDPTACRSWTATAGHTSGAVREQPAPALEAADTIGMTTSATTVVEGGTETRTDADTFVAHLGRFVCFVALVTDPGSAHPRLDAGFAADLLVETVSALRS